MSVRVAIIDGPIPPPEPRAPAPSCAGAGAALVFEGIVRGLEDGRAIEGLHYTAYEPMALRTLESIAHAIVREHGLLALEVVHSRGFVPAGACSLRVTARSAHRAEALAGVASLIDLLKRDVPIWKRAVWAGQAGAPGPTR